MTDKLNKKLNEELKKLEEALGIKEKIFYYTNKIIRFAVGPDTSSGYTNRIKPYLIIANIIILASCLLTYLMGLLSLKSLVPFVLIQRLLIIIFITKLIVNLINHLWKRILITSDGKNVMVGHTKMSIGELSKILHDKNGLYVNRTISLPYDRLNSFAIDLLNND